MTKIEKTEYLRAKSSSIWILFFGTTAATAYFQTKYLDPFNTPKLIIILMLSGWLLGHVINSFRLHTKESNLVYIKIVVLPVLFIIAMFISLLSSERFVVALIGESQRRNGFLAYLALTIILLFAARNITMFYANRLIKLILILGLSLSFYGVLQVNGKDFVQWDNPYNSMLITLGNPNFASSFLAMISIISVISLFIKNINQFYKTVGVITIIMSIYSVVNSQSRQGLLVMSFGIVFYTCVYADAHKWKQRFIIFTLSFAATILAIFGMLQQGPLANLLYKDSVSVRGFYWRAGVEMFLDYPLTGIGLDNYGSFFKEYRESSYPLRYGFNLTSSNAHNTFIQLFSTGGLFVGLSYLLLLISIFVVGIKLVRKADGDDRKIVLALLSAWVGFQAQSLISIDNIGISIWGWLFGGSILGLSYTNRYEKDGNSKFNKKSHTRISIFQPLASGFFLIPLGLLAFSMHQFESKSYQIRGMVSSQDIQIKNLYTKYAYEVIRNPIADPSYKFLAARAFVNADFFDQSYLEMIKLYKSDKRNLDYLQWLSEYELSKNNALLELKYREEIARFDPWNAENLLRLGQLYKANGDFNKVSKVLEIINSFAKNTEIGKSAAELLN